MVMKQLLSFLVFLTIVTSGFSQTSNQEIILKNISGKASAQSINEAKTKAIENAKMNALYNAGIEENLNSYTDLFRAESGNNYEELFASGVFIDIRGAVKNVDIVEEKSRIVEGDYIIVDVLINCTVIKYNSLPDPLFNADISGILPFYYNEDNLKFSITSSQNSWLNVYVFTKSEAYELFPNKIEKSFQLQQNVKYDFPVIAKYYMTCNKLEQETNRIVFILMKNDYPYAGEISYKSISDWIFSLPPSERVIYSFTTIVHKNSR